MYTAHIDSNRDLIAHTYVSIVHFHTQKELGHCDLFSEIYDHFVKNSKICDFFQAMIPI